MPEPEPEICPACSDTGWLPCICLGWDHAICGRKRTHLPHDFAKPCPCRDMNRRYQERIASRRVA